MPAVGALRDAPVIAQPAGVARLAERAGGAVDRVAGLGFVHAALDEHLLDQLDRFPRANLGGGVDGGPYRAGEGLPIEDFRPERVAAPLAAHELTELVERDHGDEIEREPVLQDAELVWLD